jgi:hypothetical protein
MNVEVDQRGKVGDTNRKTVLAYSNDTGRSLVIPARVKRECMQWLRRRGTLDIRSYLQIFVAGLYLLLEDELQEIEQITIDIECPGHDGTIRGMLLQHIWRVVPGFPKENVIFAQIGRKSRAHEKAYRTFRGKIQADRVVKTRELLAMLR